MCVCDLFKLTYNTLVSFSILMCMLAQVRYQGSVLIVCLSENADCSLIRLTLCVHCVQI